MLFCRKACAEQAGTILGTFGTYFRDHRTPTPEEKTGVEHLAAAAALVLAKAWPSLL